MTGHSTPDILSLLDLAMLCLYRLNKKHVNELLRSMNQVPDETERDNVWRPVFQQTKHDGKLQ